MKKLKLDSAKLKLKKEKIADLTLEDFKNIQGGKTVHTALIVQTKNPLLCTLNMMCRLTKDEIGCKPMPEFPPISIPLPPIVK